MSVHSTSAALLMIAIYYVIIDNIIDVQDNIVKLFDDI